MSEEERLLRQAGEALRSGDRGQARRLLAQVLRANPNNPQAWLQLSSLVVGLQQRRECLRRVLSLEPENKAAQAGLQWLEMIEQREGERPVQEGTQYEIRLLDVRHTLQGSATRGSELIAPVSAEVQGRPPPKTTEHVLPSRRPVLDEGQRRRGYRNAMVALALSLTLLCGLVLLVATLTRIVP
jgi:hypothetical protein